MPNIMLTYRCNLKCPYCFANEFVNKDSTNITLENFKKALDFITKEGPTRIGLIGGEPTLHPQFEEILEIIIKNKLVTECTIYTNGVLLDKFIRKIVHPKFRMLVNCNSAIDIGEAQFNRIRDNLDIFFKEYYMKDRINLGINLYDKNMNYQYIMDLLERYDLHRVRISITVPDFNQNSEINVLDYFKAHKEFLLKFFKDMDNIKVVPYYDCNKPPYCIWTSKEKEWLEKYIKKYNIQESNLIGNKSYCYPVIDILPNLQAVRCFGMSDFEKVKISDFNSMTDIASYYLNKIDSLAYKISASKECKNCYDRCVRQCTTGCIGFKASKISQINAACENI